MVLRRAARARLEYRRASTACGWSCASARGQRLRVPARQRALIYGRLSLAAGKVGAGFSALARGGRAKACTQRSASVRTSRGRFGGWGANPGPRARPQATSTARPTEIELCNFSVDTDNYLLTRTLRRRVQRRSSSDSSMGRGVAPAPAARARGPRSKSPVARPSRTSSSWKPRSSDANLHTHC